MVSVCVWVGVLLQELDFFKPLPLPTQAYAHIDTHTHIHGTADVVVTTPPLYACETLARESVIGMCVYHI